MRRGTDFNRSMYGSKEEVSYDDGWSLSLTKFLQPLNLAIFTTLFLFNLLAIPAPHLVSLFLAVARQPSPH